MKNKILVTLEKGKDLYGAFSDIPGVHGAGETIQEAKESVEECIRLFVTFNAPENIPEELKEDYELVYKFDAPSFFNYYKGIFTNAALERLTGINQKQLQHYATGHRKPRPAMKQKIETALHKLGAELMAVEL